MHYELVSHEVATWTGLSCRDCWHRAEDHTAVGHNCCFCSCRRARYLLPPDDAHPAPERRDSDATD
jgi:hypothetical protein